MSQIAHPAAVARGPAMPILVALSCSHFLNDMGQSLLPAIYPLLKEELVISFAQIGMISMSFQITGSILQPLVGVYTDKHPMPYSLPLGMGLSFLGLLLLSAAHSFPLAMLAAALIGMGSAVFHPESSRATRLASGGRYGFAQSLFQVGGNLGQASGPLLAALIILPGGQSRVAWFSLAALLAVVILWQVASWTKQNRPATVRTARTGGDAAAQLPRREIAWVLIILLVLMVSKYFYQAGINSFYMFYLIEKFQISVYASQMYLFAFMGSVALGTLLGGPIGDRFGRRFVMWYSILGALPFTIALPYADLFWTAVLSVLIGFIMASSFAAILVYGQELMPGRVGTVSGLFFGLAFGLGGIGAVLLGVIADLTSVSFVYKLTSFLPLLGVLIWFLPEVKEQH